MTEPPANIDYSDADARRADCWFDVDHVSHDPETTLWKRRARWSQARWREARGFPIGTHPYAGGPKASRIGSRLELAFAKASGSNFVTPGALTAARSRLATPEKYQTLLESRLWADLLSSMPLCFNLFGPLTTDPAIARRAIRTWWSDAPEGDVHVRFEHSPGRRDPSFLGNQSAFDAAFEIAGRDGTRGIVGVDAARAIAQRYLVG